MMSGARFKRSLLLFGDTDFVALEHAVEMFERTPNAQLAVLPGTTSGLRSAQNPCWP